MSHDLDNFATCGRINKHCFATYTVLPVHFTANDFTSRYPSVPKEMPNFAEQFSGYNWFSTFVFLDSFNLFVI